MKIRAVLFDLDDTLSDHLACARAGLTAQQQRHDLLAQVPLKTLENEYSIALEATHTRMLAGELTTDQARVIRTQQFFDTFGITLSEQRALEEYAHHRTAYDAAISTVSGSHELLTALTDRGYRLGVITNNLEAEQLAKLARLELRDYFEMLAISGEIGVPKPDPQIFHVALDRMSLAVDDVVMVGDSLTSDIAGAIGVGMRSVWVDRHQLGAHHAPPEVQAVIDRDLADTDAALQAILGDQY